MAETISTFLSLSHFLKDSPFLKLSPLKKCRFQTSSSLPPSFTKLKHHHHPHVSIALTKFPLRYFSFGRSHFQKGVASQRWKMAKIFVQVIVTLCLVWWLSATMVDADNLKYVDPRQPVSVRVKDLLGRMTLEEKICQMAQIDRSVANATVTKNSYIGAGAQVWVNMINGIQRGSLSSRLGIPMMNGVDAVHGHINNAYNATIFPHNVGLGATRYIH